MLTVASQKTLRQSGLIRRMVTNGCSAILSSWLPAILKKTCYE